MDCMGVPSTLRSEVQALESLSQSTPIIEFLLLLTVFKMKQRNPLMGC